MPPPHPLLREFPAARIVRSICRSWAPVARFLPASFAPPFPPLPPVGAWPSPLACYRVGPEKQDVQRRIGLDGCQAGEQFLGLGVVAGADGLAGGKVQRHWVLRPRLGQLLRHSPPRRRSGRSGRTPSSAWFAGPIIRPLGRGFGQELQGPAGCRPHTGRAGRPVGPAAPKGPPVQVWRRRCPGPSGAGSAGKSRPCRHRRPGWPPGAGRQVLRLFSLVHEIKECRDGANHRHQQQADEPAKNRTRHENSLPKKTLTRPHAAFIDQEHRQPLAAADSTRRQRCLHRPIHGQHELAGNLHVLLRHNPHKDLNRQT